jgi:hypothetical protein
MPSDLEPLGRLLLAAVLGGAVVRHGLTVRGVATRAAAYAVVSALVRRCCCASAT